MPSFQTPALRPLALALGLVVAAGCATRKPSPAPLPPRAPTQPIHQAPAPTPAPAAIAEAERTQPTRPPPPVPPVLPADAAGQIVVELLVRQLRVAPATVSLLEVSEAVWPDGCLGLPAEDEICAGPTIPGFTVKVEAGGLPYEFRTDASARHLRLAAAPPPAIGEPRLTWRDARSFTVLRIGSDGLAFGRRGRPLLSAPFPRSGRAAELQAFVATYAPLQARTAAGEVVLRGLGTREATPAEQRMLAEWARVVELEAESGSPASAPNSVLTWTRAAVASGLRETLIVDRTGIASLFSAGTAVGELAGSLRLAPAELEQVYHWMDHLASFSARPPAAPGADLALTGEGAEEAGPDTLAQIAALMEGLAGRIAAR